MDWGAQSSADVEGHGRNLLVCGQEGDDGTVWVETEETVVGDCSELVNAQLLYRLTHVGDGDPLIALSRPSVLVSSSPPRRETSHM